ncbi:MAG: hypothetical protein Q9217_002285 [Psora testacea]
MAIEDKGYIHFVGSFLEDKVRDILGKDSTNEKVNSEQSNDQLDNANSQTTNDNPGEDHVPKEPEPPQSALTDSPLAFGTLGKFVDDIAKKPPIEEAPFAEHAATEPQTEPTLDDVDGRPALYNEQPVEELDCKDFAPGMHPGIEPLAVNPSKLVIQPVSIADAIQNILKDQDINTSYLRRQKSKSKKRLHSRAYDSEMSKIKQLVSEKLRD